MGCGEACDIFWLIGLLR